ncbi:hypothetical protein EON65_43355 [archaeon]|nr:MAG: hypothetical protein EON65_43355 [archaeon]
MDMPIRVDLFNKTLERYVQKNIANLQKRK